MSDWKSRAIPVSTNDWKSRALSVDALVDPSVERAPVSQAESALRGIANGATAGFADEITGGGEALLDKLSGKNDAKSLMDLYRQHRDESRANYEQAKEDNPWTYGAGNLAGGVGTIALTGGLGAGVEGLSGAAALKAAAVQGAKLGAVQGVGEGTADLTQGDVGGAAKEALTGGAIGGVAGGVMHGVGMLGGKALDVLKNTKFGSNAGTNYDLGKEGINLLNKDARFAVGQEPIEFGKEWSKKLFGKKTGLLSKKGKAIDDTVADITKKTDAKKLVDDLTKAISGLDDRNPAEKADKETLTNLLKGFTGEETIETPIMGSVVDRGGIEEVPGKPSAMDDMQHKLSLLQDEAYDQGQTMSTTAEQADIGGKPMIKGRTFVDEPVNATERVVPGEPVHVADAVTDTHLADKVAKVRSSFDNTPKGKEKAEALASKLRTKYKIEPGNGDAEVSVIHDPQEGKYVVIEKRPAPPVEASTSEVPGEPTLDTSNTADNYKSNSKNYYMDDVLGVEPTTVENPLTYGDETQLGSISEANPDYAQMTPEDLLALKRAGSDKGLYGKDGSLKSQAGQYIAGGIADATDKTIGSQVPGFNQANTEAKAMYDARKLLKAKGGEENFTNAQRLASIPQRLKSETVAGDNKRSLFDKLNEVLKTADPSTAKEFDESANNVAKRYEAVRAATNESHFSGGSLLDPSYYLGKAQIGANVLGTIVKKAENVTNPIRTLANSSVEGLTKFADSISSSGDAGQKIASVFREAANRDSVGRNALLFTLMQNPAYREVINNFLGEKKDN